MAWRPNENYGYGYNQYQYHQQPRGRGYRGFGVHPANVNDSTFGRGYARAVPEMPRTIPHGYGRGRFHFTVPQMSENPALNLNNFASYAHIAAPTSGTEYLSNTLTHQYSSHPHNESKQHKSNEDMVNKEIEVIESVWNDNKFPDKKSKLEALFRKLSTILATKPNPWESAYSLITMAPDYEAAKTMTLSFQILLQFEKWVRSSHNVHAGQEEKFLTQDFRVQVFYATTGRHLAYFSSAVDAFHLCHPGNEYFLSLAKSLLLRDKLPEAAQVVSRLGLQAHFTRDEILVPLLLTDRVNLIESYIKGDNQQQMLILNLLDYLCARNTDIVSYAQSTGLKNMKAEKLSKKSLSKFAMRLIKMFDIPPEMCPNISENRAMSTVRFLLYKHYIEKSMTAECWDDMVESVIGNSVSLQQQFILELMYFNDVKEAVKWVDKYQLPDTILDPSVVEAKKNYIRENEVEIHQRQSSHQPIPSSSSVSGEHSGKIPSAKDDVGGEKEEEDWDNEMTAPDKITTAPLAFSDNYYTIPLKEEDIVLVDTRDRLTSALERLTRPSSIIGIDCEWKPIGPTKQVALLQLAVCDKVFLVDFIQLEGLVSQQDWRHFAHSLFCDDKILKIGYGLDTDLRMLSSTFPSMKEPLLKMVRVVELAKLAKTVDDLLLSKEESALRIESKKNKKSELREGEEGTSAYHDETDHVVNERETNTCDKESGMEGAVWDSAGLRSTIGFPHKNEEKGLSLLVKKIIGKPLCKDEQMSNWEKRPLRRSQILYAAMDAYVLVEIHNHLLSQARSLGVNDQQILEPSVVFRTKSRLDKKKHKMNYSKKSPATSNTNCTHVTTSCRPHELRVVCDSMLQGLGNQLRSCGVDTHILSTGQLHDDAVQVALRDNRIVLTTGMPYEQVRSRVGEGMCYCVSNTMKSKDQCIDVLRHFKVEVNVDDIFSRCAVCNQADFAHIPSVDMEKLFVLNLQRQQHHHHHHYHQPSTTAYPSSRHHYNILDVGVDVNEQQAFLSKYGVDTFSLTFMHNGVRLQVETVASLEAFQTIDLFFVCVGCGKVYWKGSHFQRIQEQFKPVLTLNSQPTPPPHCQQVADVIAVKDLDGDDSNVADANDFYGEEDLDAVQNDLGNFNLHEAGFSGVWKIN